MNNVAGTVKLLSQICGVSDRKLRRILLEIGLSELLNKARHLQVIDAFSERQPISTNEQIHFIHDEYLKESLEYLNNPLSSSTGTVAKLRNHRA